jgi:hypothetical protein
MKAKPADGPLIGGDRVRLGDKTGVVTVGSVPAPWGPGGPPGLEQENACRVRWDGKTFSVLVDKRTLERVT